MAIVRKSVERDWFNFERARDYTYLQRMETRELDERWQREDLLFDLEEAWSDRDLERADVLLALLIGNLGRERMRVAEEVIVERLTTEAE